MANCKQRNPKNGLGKFYVDNNCLDHACCEQLAPKNFARDNESGCYYVCKQPETKEELAQCMQAVESCPMAAIGTDGDKRTRRSTGRQSRIPFLICVILAGLLISFSCIRRTMLEAVQQ
jgi:ferredoxin